MKDLHKKKQKKNDRGIKLSKFKLVCVITKKGDPRAVIEDAGDSD